MNTDSDDSVFVDDRHMMPAVEEESEEVSCSGLRELTEEEQQYLFDHCSNQLHYAQEELRLRMSPAEL
jgi:hypothetical protein